MKNVLFLMITLLSLTQCEQASSQKSKINYDYLQDNWSDGLAEITKYDLSQNRYNNIHSGHIIQVLVSEDFLTDKQVKNESYTSSNSTKVLKRIETRHFNTGIYDYNMLSSSFTPFDVNKYPNTLKVSSSSQEWCGTTFSQLNKTNKGYKHTLFSYFEKEGETVEHIKDGISEEEIFTKIRMDPNLLPEGNFNFIPSNMVSRLLHLDQMVYTSEGAFSDYIGKEFSGKNLKSYTIKTPGLQRTIHIIFESQSPYNILGWIDTYPSLFDKKPRQTIAKQTHQIREAYWKLNNLGDAEMREKLGLRN